MRALVHQARSLRALLSLFPVPYSLFPIRYSLFLRQPGVVVLPVLDAHRFAADVKRLERVDHHGELVDRWYTQMLRVPRQRLIALVRLGEKIVGYLPTGNPTRRGE